jgi:hypothetical protein
VVEVAKVNTANWVVSVPPKARSAIINAAVFTIRQNLRTYTVSNLLTLPTMSRIRRRRPFSL